MGLEGCSPLQPRNPIKATTVDARSSRPNKAFIDERGAEGPDALQVLIKAPMVLPDFDRGRESAGSPSLRTGQALFTHPALQLMGSNSETEVFEF